MFLESLLLIVTAGTTFYLKNVYEKRKKQVSLSNVLRIFKNIAKYEAIREDLKESEVEILLAKCLSRYFSEVQTQHLVNKLSNSKDRIDIDIGKGRLGIEIKLARLLKKSTERKRLLGQIDLYTLNNYGSNNLLVLIVGNEAEAKNEQFIELKKILENKGTYVFYLKTKKTIQEKTKTDSLEKTEILNLKNYS